MFVPSIFSPKHEFTRFNIGSHFLGCKSQCFEDFELRANAKSSKFMFWTKYARYELNESSNGRALIIKNYYIMCVL